MTFHLIIENAAGKLSDYSDVKRNTMNKKKVVRNAKTGKFAAKSKAKTSPAKHVEETVERRAQWEYDNEPFDSVSGSAVIISTCNKKGIDGWELVSVVGSNLFFKRLK
jgi:hypothetical protein